MASLTIRGAKKSYGSVDVIHGIDLDINNGDFVVFVGPSGCGKSTLLRMIAGLENITQCEISIGERVVNEVAPSKRGVAMVFQTYALYPHMTVYKNMAFGLKQAKTPPDEIDRRVQEVARILKIEDYLERTPKALSGGQRQRVAIGRAIVREPDVFLFDEPLSNLDAALRGQTRLEIAGPHERLGTTMVYVTHDQVEAMTLADKIVVLRDGRVEQFGTPMELHERPANTFVAGFIGSPAMNFFKAANIGNGIGVQGASVAIREGSADQIDIGIRPEHLTIADTASAHLSGRLEVVEQLGDHVLAHCVTKDDVPFVAKMESLGSAKRGETIPFAVKSGGLHTFHATSGHRL